MTLVSHAQNFEDVVLWRALGSVADGFYIDVGAAWPDVDSVTKLFYERGWTGINIEPNPSLVCELDAARQRDVNLGIALGDRAGRLRLSIVEGTGLSTLTEEYAGGYRQRGLEIRSIEVEVRTLRDVISGHVPDDQEIHFLKIDVEGFEGHVIAGHDWTTRRPWIVVVEATRPTSQEVSIDWEPRLLEADYQLVYDDGLNRFYVATEHSELVASFSSPPNVFDGFITAAHELAERRASAFEVASIEQHHRAEVAEEQLRLFHERVDWLEDRAQRLEQRLDSTHRALLDANRHIGTLEAGRDEQRRNIGALEASIGEQQRIIAELQHLATHLADDLRAREEALGVVQAESAARATWIAHLEAHAANLDRHISDMHRSTSWRVTRPLRGVSALVHDPVSVARRLVGRARAGSARTEGALASRPTPFLPADPDDVGAATWDDSTRPRAATTELSPAAAALQRQIESDLGHQA